MEKRILKKLEHLNRYMPFIDYLLKLNNEKYIKFKKIKEWIETKKRYPIETLRTIERSIIKQYTNLFEDGKPPQELIVLFNNIFANNYVDLCSDEETDGDEDIEIIREPCTPTSNGPCQNQSDTKFTEIVVSEIKNIPIKSDEGTASLIIVSTEQTCKNLEKQNELHCDGNVISIDSSTDDDDIENKNKNATFPSMPASIVPSAIVEIEPFESNALREKNESASTSLACAESGSALDKRKSSSSKLPASIVTHSETNKLGMPSESNLKSIVPSAIVNTKPIESNALKEVYVPAPSSLVGADVGTALNETKSTSTNLPTSVVKHLEINKLDTPNKSILPSINITNFSPYESINIDQLNHAQEELKRQKEEDSRLLEAEAVQKKKTSELKAIQLQTSTIKEILPHQDNTENMSMKQNTVKPPIKKSNCANKQHLNAVYFEDNTSNHLNRTNIEQKKRSATKPSSTKSIPPERYRPKFVCKSSSTLAIPSLTTKKTVCGNKVKKRRNSVLEKNFQDTASSDTDTFDFESFQLEKLKSLALRNPPVVLIERIVTKNPMHTRKLDLPLQSEVDKQILEVQLIEDKNKTINKKLKIRSTVGIAMAKPKLRRTNTDSKMTEQNTMFCVLCKSKPTNLTNHYKRSHKTESYVSRLTAKQLNTLQLNTPNVTAVASQYKVKCFFCDEVLVDSLMKLYNHYSTHTGEYAFQCISCGLQKPFRVDIQSHQNYSKACRNKRIQTLYLYQENLDCIYLHCCRLCNFVQLNAANVLKHLQDHHDKQHDNPENMHKYLLAKMYNSEDGIRTLNSNSLEAEKKFEVYADDATICEKELNLPGVCDPKGIIPTADTFSSVSSLGTNSSDIMVSIGRAMCNNRTIHVPMFLPKELQYIKPDVNILEDQLNSTNAHQPAPLIRNFIPIHNYKTYPKGNPFFGLHKCMVASCLFSTNIDDEMLQHLNNSSCSGRDEFLNCAYCPLDANSFDSAKTLISHTREKHRYNRFQCCICSYRSCVPGNVVIHQQHVHQNEKDALSFFVYECDGNASSSNEQSPQVIEILMLENVQKLPCPHCSKGFYAIEAIVEHLKHVYSGVIIDFNAFNRYACIYCTEGSNDDAYMQKHLALKHPDEIPYVCERVLKPELEIDSINNLERRNVSLPVPLKSIVSVNNLQLHMNSQFNMIPLEENQNGAKQSVRRNVSLSVPSKSIASINASQYRVDRDTITNSEETWIKANHLERRNSSLPVPPKSIVAINDLQPRMSSPFPTIPISEETQKEANNLERRNVSLSVPPNSIGSINDFQSSMGRIIPNAKETCNDVSNLQRKNTTLSVSPKICLTGNDLQSCMDSIFNTIPNTKESPNDVNKLALLLNSTVSLNDFQSCSPSNTILNSEQHTTSLNSSSNINESVAAATNNLIYDGLEPKPNVKQLIDINIAVLKSLLLKLTASTGVSPDLLYRCPKMDCNGYFSIFEHWSRHMVARHQSIITECPHCVTEYSFSDDVTTELQLADFEQHFEQHRRHLFLCFHCGQTYVSEDCLREHAAATHAEITEFRMEKVPCSIIYSYNVLIDSSLDMNKLKFLLELREVIVNRLKYLETMESQRIISRWAVASSAPWLEEFPQYSTNVPHGGRRCIYVGCNFHTSDTVELCAHICATHEISGHKYMCTRCDFRIISHTWDPILEHLKMHNLNIFICCVCSYYHFDWGKVIGHIRNTHDSRDVPVLELLRCGGQTNVEIFVVFSKARCTFSTMKNCFCCPANNLHPAAMGMHLKKEHKLTLHYFCEFCNEHFPKLRNIEEHFRSKHALESVKIRCKLASSSQLTIETVRPLRVQVKELPAGTTSQLTTKRCSNLLKCKDNTQQPPTKVQKISLKHERNDDDSDDCIFMDEDDIVIAEELKSNGSKQQTTEEAPGTQLKCINIQNLVSTQKSTPQVNTACPTIPLVRIATPIATTTCNNGYILNPQNLNRMTESQQTSVFTSNAAAQSMKSIVGQMPALQQEQNSAINPISALDLGTEQIQTQLPTQHQLHQQLQRQQQVQHIQTQQQHRPTQHQYHHLQTQHQHLQTQQQHLQTQTQTQYQHPQAQQQHVQTHQHHRYIQTQQPHQHPQTIQHHPQTQQQHPQTQQQHQYVQTQQQYQHPQTIQQHPRTQQQLLQMQQQHPQTQLYQLLQTKQHQQQQVPLQQQQSNLSVPAFDHGIEQMQLPTQHQLHHERQTQNHQQNQHQQQQAPSQQQQQHNSGLNHIQTQLPSKQKFLQQHQQQFYIEQQQQLQQTLQQITKTVSPIPTLNQCTYQMQTQQPQKHCSSKSTTFPNGLCNQEQMPNISYTSIQYQQEFVSGSPSNSVSPSLQPQTQYLLLPPTKQDTTNAQKQQPQIVTITFPSLQSDYIEPEPTMQ